MPHNQMIMSKKTNILSFAPRLRLANQTDKLVAVPSRLSFRLETARGWAAVVFRCRAFFGFDCLAAVDAAGARAAAPVGVLDCGLAGGGKAAGVALA